MYVAHSNLDNSRLLPKKVREASSFIAKMEHKLWTKAIAKTLKKHEAEISKIQEICPGWQPVFKKK